MEASRELKNDLRRGGEKKTLLVYELSALTREEGAGGVWALRRNSSQFAEKYDNMKFTAGCGRFRSFPGNFSDALAEQSGRYVFFISKNGKKLSLQTLVKKLDSPSLPCSGRQALISAALDDVASAFLGWSRDHAHGSRR